MVVITEEMRAETQKELQEYRATAPLNENGTRELMELIPLENIVACAGELADYENPTIESEQAVMLCKISISDQTSTLRHPSVYAWAASWGSGRSEDEVREIVKKYLTVE